MRSNQIRKLIDLAENGKTRDVALFVKASNECRDLVEQLELIQKQIGQHKFNDEIDFSAIARWQRWNDAETKRLHARISEAVESKSKSRKIATKSAAKVQVLETLLKKALKVEVQANRRRAEQNGQPPDA